MPDLQSIISDLESMQYDILFWKRKEKDNTAIEKLAKYDTIIDQVIEDLNDYDMER